MEVRVGALLEWRRYWNLLRRWWWLLLLGLLVGAGIGLASSLLTPRVYKAQTYLLINQVANPVSPGTSDVPLSQSVASQYALLLRSAPFLQETVKELDFTLTPEEVGTLGQRITAQLLPGTQYLVITVSDSDPARAAAIANQLPKVLIQRTQDQRTANVEPVRQEVERELNEARQRVTEASNRLNELRASPAANSTALLEVQRLQTDLALYQNVYFGLLGTQRQMRLDDLRTPSLISVVIPAGVPSKPAPRGTLQNTLLGGFAGLLLMLGLAATIEFLKDRVRDPAQLRRRFNLAPLAVVPFVRRAQARTLADPMLPVSAGLLEAMRLLRANLGFVTGGDPTAVCVSGASPREGTSTVAANLALAEAQAGKQVILIDANLRDPALHRLFGLENDQGLSTFLAQTSPTARPALQDGPLGVRILAGGPVSPNPTELLSSRRMAELVGDLRQEADVIVLDSAPLLPFADTLTLQRLVDGTVLVMDAQRTGTKTLERALIALQQPGGRVLGVVLNKDTEGMATYGSGDSQHRHRPVERVDGRLPLQPVPALSGARSDHTDRLVRTARDD